MGIEDIVYSPQAAAKLAVEALEELRNNSVGVKSGISSLDEVMLPLRGGELVTVLGYTSHYKTGFMNWLLKSAVQECQDGEVAVKVTWEDSVEEETLKWIANDSNISVTAMVRGKVDDWDLVMRSYARRISTPLWIVGHSNQESYNGRKARPRLTMTDVMEAVEYIISCGGAPRMVVLDYLQRIRPDYSDGNNKREQMMEAVNKAKDLAIQFGCPVVLGVQASRGILSREFKLPRLDDGLETSNIEQSSDKAISLWYPMKTEELGVMIDAVGVPVTENLLIVGLLKQKLGLAPVILPLHLDASRGVITSITREEI